MTMMTMVMIMEDDSDDNGDDADDVCNRDDGDGNDVDGRLQWEERQPAHRPPLLRALRSHHRQVGQSLLNDRALSLA